MNLLVTGATGFVMSHVVRHLAEQGHAVTAADLHPPDARLRGFLSGLPGPVTFRQVDVGDRGSVRAMVTELRPDRAVHGAAITSIPADAERARFLETAQVNVMGTLHVLDALRVAGTSRVVVISSGSIYGAQAGCQPVTEDAPANPEGVYALTKWSADALARRFAEVHGMELAVARLASPFGPFERDTGSRPLLSMVQTWTDAARHGRPIRVDGSPAQARDVVYVADVGSAIAAMLLAPRPLPHRAYNVGWGRLATAQEVLAALARLVPGLGVTFREDAPGPWANLGRGPLDCARLRALGWTPAWTLESGLAAHLEWLRADTPPTA